MIGSDLIFYGWNDTDDDGPQYNSFKEETVYWVRDSLREGNL